jgi:hypothetical protein
LSGAQPPDSIPPRRQCARAGRKRPVGAAPWGKTAPTGVESQPFVGGRSTSWLR